MALTAFDAKHALQIQAGILGRNTGHKYEAELAKQINQLPFSIRQEPSTNKLIIGSPERSLVNKALEFLRWKNCDKVEALALGTLATADEGKQWLNVHGIVVKACKSDILLTIYKGKLTETVGVSVKQCNNKTPTNAQLYFTTARAFCNLLINNGITVSKKAIKALRQFCGDDGFRPLDSPSILKGRIIDPRRFFWEEIDSKGRVELEKIFSKYQNKITKLLLQKAYLNDPFTPQVLIHKTKKNTGDLQEYALYTIDELVLLSEKYAGFKKKKYIVRKGQHKDPERTEHDAPRFGIVQMQRGGQKQHPTQLQFNLQAGYFYNI